MTTLQEYKDDHTQTHGPKGVANCPWCQIVVLENRIYDACESLAETDGFKPNTAGEVHIEKFITRVLEKLKLPH